MFLYCLTFLWVYQHLSSCRSFIKYYLLQIFASFPLFSPLNHGLKERFTMHISFMCILYVNHQEFPGLWGWHLNLHKNLYSSLCLMWSLKQDQRRQSPPCRSDSARVSAGMQVVRLLYLEIYPLKNCVCILCNIIISCSISPCKVIF